MADDSYANYERAMDDMAGVQYQSGRLGQPNVSVLQSAPRSAPVSPGFVDTAQNRAKVQAIEAAKAAYGAVAINLASTRPGAPPPPTYQPNKPNFFASFWWWLISFGIIFAIAVVVAVIINHFQQRS